jgi:hypothetical protein
MTLLAMACDLRKGRSNIHMRDTEMLITEKSERALYRTRSSSPVGSCHWAVWGDKNCVGGLRNLSSQQKSERRERYFAHITSS